MQIHSQIITQIPLQSLIQNYQKCWHSEKRLRLNSSFFFICLALLLKKLYEKKLHLDYALDLKIIFFIDNGVPQGNLFSDPRFAVWHSDTCACPRQVYTLRAAWFEPRAAPSAVWKAGQWATTSKLMKNIIFILAVFCITAYTGVILAAKYYEVTGENPPNVI